MVDVYIKVDAPEKQDVGGGWRYFWAKTVTGFDASIHCMQCLIGDRIEGISPKLLTKGGKVGKRFKTGTMLYICGVSYPYIWDRNFHMPVRVKRGASSRARTYTGAIVTVEGAERIAFNDHAALAHFGQKGPRFLTCRNFQFAAQEFAHKGFSCEVVDVEGPVWKAKGRRLPISKMVDEHLLNAHRHARKRSWRAWVTRFDAEIKRRGLTPLPEE